MEGTKTGCLNLAVSILVVEDNSVVWIISTGHDNTKAFESALVS